MTKVTTKLVHAGEYVAEVEVELIDGDAGQILCSSQARWEERNVFLVGNQKPPTNLTGEPATFQDPNTAFMQQRR